MDIGNLVRMANRIGDFFESMPDREEGVRGVAMHIKNVWEPRMRTALLEFVRTNPEGEAGDVRIKPIVLTAIQRNAEMLQPRSLPR